MLAPLTWLLALAASPVPAEGAEAAAPTPAQAPPAAEATGSDARASGPRGSDAGARAQPDDREADREADGGDDGGEADPADDDPSEAPPDPDDAPSTKPRKLALGLEGLVLQATPLRPEVVRFDPRFLGRSVSMAGLGLFARYRLHPRIAIEATVRSGSVRYAASGENDDVVSQDQVMVDGGVLLFVAQGEMAQLAFDAGLGGMGTRVRYELDREGTQRFGSGLVRVGVDAEFVLKRIVFVVSFRTLGVFTRRDAVRSFGPLLEGKDLLAPVPTLQTQLVGSAGIAYRF